MKVLLIAVLVHFVRATWMVDYAKSFFRRKNSQEPVEVMLGPTDKAVVEFDIGNLKTLIIQKDNGELKFLRRDGSDRLVQLNNSIVQQVSAKLQAAIASGSVKPVGMGDQLRIHQSGDYSYTVLKPVEGEIVDLDLIDALQDHQVGPILTTMLTEEALRDLSDAWSRKKNFDARKAEFEERKRTFFKHKTDTTVSVSH